MDTKGGLYIRICIWQNIKMPHETVPGSAEVDKEMQAQTLVHSSSPKCHGSRQGNAVTAGALGLLCSDWQHLRVQDSGHITSDQGFCCICI
jgi:hypothetical protein